LLDAPAAVERRPVRAVPEEAHVVDPEVPAEVIDVRESPEVFAREVAVRLTPSIGAWVITQWPLTLARLRSHLRLKSPPPVYASRSPFRTTPVPMTPMFEEPKMSRCSRATL
jgi:hypothetical protein